MNRIVLGKWAIIHLFTAALWVMILMRWHNIKLFAPTKLITLRTAIIDHTFTTRDFQIQIHEST